MTPRVISMLVAATAVIVSVSACGGSGTTAPVTKPDTSTAVTKPDLTPVTTPDKPPEPKPDPTPTPPEDKEPAEPAPESGGNSP